MIRIQGELAVTDIVEPVAPIDQQQLAQELVDKARTDGVNLIGPGGLLTGLTKDVLETALEAEMSDHLGYDKHDRLDATVPTRATAPGRRL